MKKSIIISLIIVLVILGVVILSLNNNKHISNLNNAKTEIVGNEYKVGYLNNLVPGEKKVLSNYSDFETYFKEYANYSYDGYGNKISSSTDSIIEKYNSEFFKNKSLAVVYFSLNSGSATVSYNGAKVEASNVIINYSITSPEIGTMDMSGYFIVVEVPKEVTSISLNKI